MSCPLCGDRHATALPHLADIARCRACGALYSPQTRIGARTVEDGYAYYQRARQVLSGEAILDLAEARRPFHARARRLEQVAKKPGRLLDVGCGDGVFCHVMQRRGWEVVGVDVEPLVVHHARDVLGLDCRVLDAENDELPAGPFDAVTLWGVLQLSHRPRRLLERIRSRLGPRGVLAIGVSTAAGAGARLFGEAWAGWGAPRHLVHFTSMTLERTVREAGFSVASASLGTPSWILRGSVEASSPGQRDRLRRLAKKLARGERSDGIELYARPRRGLRLPPRPD